MDVPADLKALRQWVLWKAENGTKVPYQVSGQKAKTSDASTWSSFDDVAGNERIGFVFTREDPLFGLDLDGCRNPETGEIAEWAQAILNELNTYAEVSPSGTGVKAFGRGKLNRDTGKKIDVDEPRVCSKAPAIEVYDWGRYFAVTGLGLGRVEIRDCQAALDRIIEHYFPVKQVPVFAPTPMNGGGCVERFRRYLAKMEPPDPRPENPMDASTQLFRAACVAIGFDLTDTEAAQVISQWDGNNPVKPYSTREIQRKLTDARKKVSPGSLAGTPDAEVDLSKIVSLSPIAQIAKKLVDPEFPDDCLDVPGLIGEVMCHNLRTALYPQPELALAGALALMGTITGRKVTDDLGTRTNVYILGLAPSGGGKEHARKINKEILMRAGAESMIGPERVGSHSGMITAIHEQPAILFQIDEIGRLLSTMKNPGKQPHLYNIGTVLLQLYSSSDSLWIGDAYAEAKKTKRINQPHACVYGTSVPAQFWDSLTAENVSEGLLGRLMAFEAAAGYVPIAKPSRAEVPSSILDVVKWWLAFEPGGSGNLKTQNPVPARIEFTKQARARLDEHLDQICRRRSRENESTAAVWSRSGEKTCKLALLFACSRAEESLPWVEIDDVERAVRVANWLTRKMLRKAFDYVAENDNEARVKKVLRMVPEDGITKYELTRKTQFLRDRRERNEILAGLVEAGMILIEAKETGGRPVECIKKTI